MPVRFPSSSIRTPTAESAASRCSGATERNSASSRALRPALLFDPAQWVAASRPCRCGYRQPRPRAIALSYGRHSRRNWWAARSISNAAICGSGSRICGHRAGPNSVAASRVCSSGPASARRLVCRGHWAVSAGHQHATTIGGGTERAASSQTDIFLEVVVCGVLAFVDLHAARAIVSRIEDLVQECELKEPRGLGGIASIAAWHSVIEPTVWRARIDFDGLGLVVDVETIAQPAHIGKRDDVVGLAKYAEHRTIESGDDAFQRIRKLLVRCPFLLAGGAVPDQCRRDLVLGRIDQRITPGLADAHHGDPLVVDLRQLRDLSD